QRPGRLLVHRRRHAGPRGPHLAPGGILMRRARLAAARQAVWLAAALLAASAFGCGHRFPAPTQTVRPPFIPPPATFIKVATWQQPGWNPTSVRLPRSGVLLVAEDSTRVQNYAALGSATEAQRSNVFTFTDLVKPVHIAASGYDIYVADMGNPAANVP